MIRIMYEFPTIWSIWYLNKLQSGLTQSVTRMGPFFQMVTQNYAPNFFPKMARPYHFTPKDNPPRGYDLLFLVKKYDFLKKG